LSSGLQAKKIFHSSLRLPIFKGPSPWPKKEA
jgi:hypothetical protein